MTRLRIALVLLFVGLAIPVGALVMRALRSAELEQRVRYETVSERIFDEMERALSEFLVREEARSPNEYRFGSGVQTLGPALAWPPIEPFIVAYFEIAPDGSLHTPLRSAGGSTSGLAGDPALPPSERARIEQAIDVLETEVAPFWRDAERQRLGQTGSSGDDPAGEDRIGAGKNQPPRAASPRPRANGPSSPIAKESKSELEDVAPGLAKAEVDRPPGFDDAGGTAPVEQPRGDEQASAYQVLQSLNVGAKKRAERREQLAEIETSPYASIADARKEAAPSEFREGLGENDARGKDRQDALAAAGSESSRIRPMARVLPSAPSPSNDAATGDGSVASRERAVAPGALEGESTAERALDQSSTGSRPAATPPARSAAAPDVVRRPAERIRVTLEPMTGRPIGERYWMLYRTVVVDGEGYRQGLLLDRRALGRWLSDQVIGSGPLAELATARFDGGGPDPDDGAAFVAFHPFAEPFSGLEAELRVAPLRDSDSATTIHLLAALLAVVAILGLGSVHRMAAVVVDFAHRRSNFVAAVSHELKTPLTAIRMHGEMLRDGLVVDESKRREYYRTITDESERLSRLIDNVLEFSRLEKEGRARSLVVGSPAPIVKDIVDRLRPHAERAGFELTTQIAEGLPTVRFDRDALTQMVFNLVDNAIKYAAGASRHEIIVCCDTGEGGGIAVSVRDFGPGVPRDHLARIFQPFHRVEDELTRSTKGSGIGLSLVKQLADAMGATVRGINRIDGGFEVRIDLVPASPA